NIGTDEICIKIATKTPSDKLLSRIKDHFRAKLRVSPKIEIHDKKVIQKLQFTILSRKPVMVIDNRKTDSYLFFSEIKPVPFPESSRQLVLAYKYQVLLEFACFHLKCLKQTTPDKR